MLGDAGLIQGDGHAREARMFCGGETLMRHWVGVSQLESPSCVMVHLAGMLPVLLGSRLPGECLPMARGHIRGLLHMKPSFSTAYLYCLSLKVLQTNHAHVTMAGFQSDFGSGH